MSSKILIFQHVPHEILGTFDPLLKRRGVRMRYVNFSRGNVDSINLESYDGLIVLGGPMSVNQLDEYPHLKEEIYWIKKAIEQDLFVLGICLGAQLISKALGGEITKSPSPEIGWFDIKLNNEGKEDPLFEFFDENQKIFQWHGDAFSIPEGAVNLASSTNCPHQAFRYGQKVYGFQFHLEVNQDLIERWLDNEVNESELEKHSRYMDIPRIRKETEQYLGPLQVLSDKTFALFLKIVGVVEKEIKLKSR
ncbi:MAG: type 1 glutamine amidotransferase [Bdellovibrionota bacterium]|nr:type 1 glutamine amidotransferase [Bdellovibrionota bacterium]